MFNKNHHGKGKWLHNNRLGDWKGVCAVGFTFDKDREKKNQIVNGLINKF